MFISKPLATVAAIIGMASAQRPLTTSMCDFYTTALFKNNTAANQALLLTKLVNTAVVGNYTQPNLGFTVPGILAPGTYKGTNVKLLKYFNGDLASSNRGGKVGVSVNFLDGGGAAPLMLNLPANSISSNQYLLLTHFYEYFGILLGCSQQGGSEFPAYDGFGSQYQVHKFMDLSYAEVGYFIQQVALSATSLGVLPSDTLILGAGLATLFNYRCLPPTTVVPAQGPQLQSMCIDNTCPIASNNTCAMYTDFILKPAIANRTVVSNSTANSTSSNGTSSSGASGLGAKNSTSSSGASGGGAKNSTSSSGAFGLGAKNGTSSSGKSNSTSASGSSGSGGSNGTFSSGSSGSTLGGSSSSGSSSASGSSGSGSNSGLGSSSSSTGGVSVAPGSGGVVGSPGLTGSSGSSGPSGSLASSGSSGSSGASGSSDTSGTSGTSGSGSSTGLGSSSSDAGGVSVAPSSGGVVGSSGPSGSGGSAGNNTTVSGNDGSTTGPELSTGGGATITLSVAAIAAGFVAMFL